MNRSLVFNSLFELELSPRTMKVKRVPLEISSNNFFFLVFFCLLIPVVMLTNSTFDSSKRDENVPFHSETRQVVSAIHEWNGQMVTLLRRLRGRLGDIVDAWDKFQQGEIGYFLFDEESPTVSIQLKECVIAIDAVFLEFKDILKKLERHAHWLCQDSPQGVCHLQSQIWKKQSAV